MKYHVPAGTWVNRRAGGASSWEALETTRPATYTEADHTNDPDWVPPDNYPYLYFRLPREAMPFVLLAVHADFIHTEPDETEVRIYDPDDLSPRIVKKVNGRVPTGAEVRDQALKAAVLHLTSP